MFLTGTVSYVVAFAILGQDDKDQLTAESVKDFSVRILSVDYEYISNPGKELLIRTVRKVCIISVTATLLNFSRVQ